MSAFTDYLEAAIRDWSSQGTAFPSAPGTVYIGLHTSNPGDAPDGSTEVSAADYDRVAVSTPGGWTTITDGSAQGFENANEESFGIAQNNWGTVTHAVLWDDTLANTGNGLYTIPLDSSKSIDVDDEPSFAAGELQATVD